MKNPFFNENSDNNTFEGLLEESISSDTPGAMSPANAQILFSKYQNLH